MRFFCLTFTLLAFVAACHPNQDRRFLTVGPGVALNDSQPSGADENVADRLKRDTLDIEFYFEQLCRQLGEDEGCYENENNPKWKPIVNTGYNDIDLRCDRYLNWIDRKRSEQQLVDTGGLALSGLLAGVLGIAAPGTTALAYLPLALNFTQDVYSAYQTAILFGLESSTVKSIVNERRYQHRLKFSGAKIEDRPSAIYAMREYLMICTPQSIVQDVNTYSRRAVVSGENIAEKDAARAASILPTPDAPAGSGGAQALNGSKHAKSFPVSGFDDDDLKAWQTANCISPTANAVGPKTLTSIAIFEATDDQAVVDGVIKDDAEFNRALVLPVCAEGLRNYYEKITYQLNPGAEQTVLSQLFNSRFGPMAADLSTPPTSINDDRVRARIKAVRGELIMEEPAGIVTDISEEMTPALRKAMDLRFLN